MPSFFFFLLSLSLSTFLSLSHIKGFLFLFSLSLELMITQQTTQFKLCTRDYITTIYILLEDGFSFLKTF